MKTKNILFGILALLCAGVIGAGGYIIGRESCVRERDISLITPTPEVTSTTVPSPSPTTTTQDIDTSDLSSEALATEDWKTYRNEELHIVFEYPQKWGEIIELEDSFQFPAVFISIGFIKGLMNSIKDLETYYCNDEHINFSILDPDALLNCNRMKVGTGQKGILRNGLKCSSNLPGGSPDCEFQTTFVINTENLKKYFGLIAQKRWGYNCFVEKCNLSNTIPSTYREMSIEELESYYKGKNMETCMRGNYKYCEKENRIELEEFNEFIGKIQILSGG